MGASQVALMVNNPPANEGDTRNVGSTPGSGRSLGEGHGNPLQDSCLKNPMDRGAIEMGSAGLMQSLSNATRDPDISISLPCHP